MQKKSEGKFSNEIYTVVEVRGKRVILNDGKVRKYDMLSKVSHVPEVKKPNIIQKAKQDYKQELILKKEDQKEENIIEGRRTRGNRINYAELAGKKNKFN